MRINGNNPVTHCVSIGRQVGNRCVKMRMVESFLRRVLVVDPFTGAVDNGQGLIFAANLVIKPGIHLLGRFGNRAVRFGLGFHQYGMGKNWQRHSQNCND